MKKMEAWFDGLPDSKKKELKADPFVFARAAWAAALVEAQASLVEKADRAHSAGRYAERDRLRDAAGAVTAA